MCSTKFTQLSGERAIVPRLSGSGSSRNNSNINANALVNSMGNGSNDYNSTQSESIDVHSVCILDANTFECQYVYELSRNECGLSLCSAQLSDDLVPYFVIGTAFSSDDTEAKQVLIYKLITSDI